MERKDFIQLLKSINEAAKYEYRAPEESPYPSDDSRDEPGGSRNYTFPAVTSRSAPASEPAKAKTTANGSEVEHLIARGELQLSPEAKQKAMSLIQGNAAANGQIYGHLVGAMQDLHKHLVSSGVEQQHPAMISLKSRIEKGLEDEKNRSENQRHAEYGY